MKSTPLSWLAAGGLCTLALVLVWRNVLAPDPGPPRPPPIDVWICADSKKEIPYTSEQLLAAYREGSFEQRGGSLRVRCPDCGKMTLYHDAHLSAERTHAQ